ncbi:MAG: hypothetical protein PHC34_06485 [Candidatus Gastranaerophilales bacterium]|nr:hypothetical protein [Candidatus Gastranaerophilales bacterium]
MNVPRRAGKIRTHAQKDSFEVMFDNFLKIFIYLHCYTNKYIVYFNFIKYISNNRKILIKLIY